MSFKELYPRPANISLTSSATNENKLITFSGVPPNFFLKSSSCVQTPTGQVFEWHCLTIIQPIATKDAVPIPYSSAPKIAAITISLPVFIPPSVLSVTLFLKPLRVRIWCTSLNPNSQGSPTCLILDWGLAPVPPE